MESKPIIVIGCGVSGLTCGIRLLEAGFDVTIVARELPPDTTSNVAAAFWYPYKAFPEDRVLEWGRITLNEFYDLMNTPDTGVSTITLWEVLDRPMPEPWWKEVVRSFEHTPAEQLPPGYKDGYTVEVPMIETPIYMRYVVRRFENAGGKIEQRAVSSLAEIDAALIVNCAGLGAREVAGDEGVFPLRGQIVRVTRLPGIHWWLDEEGQRALTYIVPRTDDCILGGTSQESNWSMEADAQTAADILRKCQELEPALKDAAILEHRVGLRPGRREVRLELEMLGENRAVIHNYGHGGAGFTLSWGCADEVTQLAVTSSRRPQSLFPA